MQYAIILSIASFFTQIFSANTRNIILADKTNKNILNIICYRVVLSLIIIFFGFYIVKEFYGISEVIVFSSFFLVCLSWTKEIFIAFSENKNSLKNEILFQVFYVSTFSICLFLYFITNDYNYIFIIPLILLVELFGRLNILIKKKRFNLKSIYFTLNYITPKLSIAFWSGFFLTLLNAIIRVLVDLNFTKLEAADYFFCFSLATFPGTIVNSIVGVSYLGKEKKFPFYFKFLLLLYAVMFVLSLIIPFDHFIFNSNLAILAVTSSGLILVLSQSVRQLNIINSSKRIFTFKRDIYFFFISLIVLLLFIIYLKNYFMFYILFSSILSLIIYVKYYNPLKNYNIKNRY